MRITQHGFTMVELVVVISIVGLLLAIGAPSYKYVTTANRIASEINGLLGDLQFARGEAIKEGQTVSICASTDGATCSGAATWTTGWIVFTDTGAIGTVDGTDQVLRTQRAIASGDSLAATGGIAAITFTREGFARNLPGTINIQVHDPTNNTGYTRCLNLTIVGAAATVTSGTGGCS